MSEYYVPNISFMLPTCQHFLLWDLEQQNMQREKGTCIICGSAATQLRPFLQIHNPTSTATDAASVAVEWGGYSHFTTL